jgi:hypothetical protein
MQKLAVRVKRTDKTFIPRSLARKLIAPLKLLEMADVNLRTPVL